MAISNAAVGQYVPSQIEIIKIYESDTGKYPRKYHYIRMECYIRRDLATYQLYVDRLIKIEGEYWQKKLNAGQRRKVLPTIPFPAIWDAFKREQRQILLDIVLKNKAPTSKSLPATTKNSAAPRLSKADYSNSTSAFKLKDGTSLHGKVIQMGDMDDSSFGNKFKNFTVTLLAVELKHEPYPFTGKDLMTKMQLANAVVGDTVRITFLGKEYFDNQSPNAKRPSYKKLYKVEKLGE